MRARVKEPANQAKEFVAARDDIQACGAAAQSNQIGLDFQLVEIIEAEVTAAEAYPGEHRIVLTEIAVGGDMNQPAMQALFAERLFAGVWTDEQLWLRQNFRHGLHFVQYLGRLGIRNAEDQG